MRFEFSFGPTMRTTRTFGTLVDLLKFLNDEVALWTYDELQGFCILDVVLSGVRSPGGISRTAYRGKISELLDSMGSYV